ncbi:MULTISPECIES: sulfatase-like hydrolase/transferase [Clostridium]|uniref:sulfatase-like hydrolase/transferase n=1 Tax=Clostridium TaxID=1485 RepID=UPI00156F9695|nr:sulfatase-like hydrolase/transferase [Clostridium beijerinckii]NRT71439.1 choline-sulfatase [Clostridium beijerinckii]
MSSKKDMLIFMSDQHSPIFSSYMGGIARTPNLEKLCENGTAFTEAYTSCPLCVPSRLSMLLGHMPSKSGIFTNDDAIPERNATFLHSLVAVGYETVLIGRMHFVGTNQRHGFTKRFVGDMTPVTWTRPAEKLAEERGVFRTCYAEPRCLDVIGGGDSPVLEYDKVVIKTALEYLSQPHDKPQCIFVSTYGPHFPYCAPPELYSYYKDKVSIPWSFDNPPDYLNPLLKNRLTDASYETITQARAAYFGMIEETDRQVGLIRDAFNTFLESRSKEGIFGYISDHGDHAGDKKLFGKLTLFENSAKIPLIFEGSDIKNGQRISTPASIMDLGPTLCELAGTEPPPAQDGKSLVNELKGIEEYNKERAVISEVIEYRKGNSNLARMVRKGQYKYITYIGYENYDMLFNIENDPEEKNNLAKDLPDKLHELREIAFNEWDTEKILEEHKNHMASVELVKAWETVVGPNDEERWKDNPEYARAIPMIQ